VRRDAGDRLRGLGRIALLGDEGPPLFERIDFAALPDERLVDEPFRHDDVRQRIDDRDVGARTELQVVVRLDVRRPHETDDARIDDDELRTLTQAALELRSEDRMRVRGIGADHDDDVRLHH